MTKIGSHLDIRLYKSYSTKCDILLHQYASIADVILYVRPIGDTNLLGVLPKVTMSKKLKKTITPKKKGKIKNNNLGNNNFEDGNPGRIDDLLDIEYHGMTLGDYLDKEYPLYGDPSMDTEQLLTLRRAQYHGIVVACKMDPRGAGEWELLVNGRLRQIQDEIEYLEEIITIKKDIVDTFD